ncbi:HK97 gp10 family phage protein [Crassaminicella profunda]|uniref:HK97 gp10 family phage protein n=1 Tax=Crassaminicella profunda TaxID=1286698 RepID=UPI001CA736DA|nr:HK97 gp10 family phage protein [Crassaminicella profunda]QZY56706.1 HK97 gp10 family phage protein [Crassaminicella profunda]
MGGIYGIDEVLRDLDMIDEEIDEAVDEIAKEVAVEILDLAVNNVNGPDTKYLQYSEPPYPVGTPTGTLKRSVKLKKVGKNKYKVFADMQVARYAWWIHEGNKFMEARPFLDDAVKNVMDTRKYIEIGNKIIENILNR